MHMCLADKHLLTSPLTIANKTGEIRSAAACDNCLLEKQDLSNEESYIAPLSLLPGVINLQVSLTIALLDQSTGSKKVASFWVPGY